MNIELKLLLLALLTVMILGACDASTESPAMSISATPLPTDLTTSLDFDALDLCVFMPVAEVESVIGKLRKEPEADPPNGSEKGCIYYNETGNFADIILSPTSDWEMLRQLQPEAEDFTLNGDTAFSAEKFDSLNLWVLREGQAVIHIRVSSAEMEQAQQLVARVIAQLP